MFFFQRISTSSDKEKGCVNNTKNLFADYEERKFEVMKVNHQNHKS